MPLGRERINGFHLGALSISPRSPVGASSLICIGLDDTPLEDRKLKPSTQLWHLVTVHDTEQGANKCFKSD